MTSNKTAFELVGVTEQDFLNWCEETHRSPYKLASKKEFFARIKDGRLAKNASGKLVVKKPRRNKQWNRLK